MSADEHDLPAEVTRHSGREMRALHPLAAVLREAEPLFPLVVARLRSGYYASLQPRGTVVVVSRTSRV